MVGAIAAVSLAARPWVGWWLDRGGTAWALLAGAAIYTLTALGYSVAASVAAILGLRAATGLAIALSVTAGQTMAVTLSPANRRGEGLSLLSIAFTLAQMSGPAVGMALALRAGYHSLFWGAATIGLLGLGLAWSMRAAPNPLAGAASPAAAAKSPAAAATLSTASAAPRRPVFHRALLVPGLLMLMLMVPFGANVGLLPLHAYRRGLGNPGLALAAHAAGVFLAQLGSGRLSDRTGRLAVILPGLVLSAAGMWATAALGGWALILAGALSGFALGVGQPSLNALGADMVPPAAHGSAMATLGIFLEIGIGLGAIGGGFLGRAWGLGTMYAIAGLGPALGAALALVQLRRLRVSASG
jgi:MFS family permease